MRERENMWENYTPRTFRAVPIPLALQEAMDDYILKAGVVRTDIFDSAIDELMSMWDAGKEEEVKALLRFNPPPPGKKIIWVQVRFTGQESFDWACHLEYKCAAVHSTFDFVRRMLSWFLRKNEVLEEYSPKEKKKRFSKI